MSSGDEAMDGADVPLVCMKHPRVEQHDDAVQHMLRSLAPHVVHAALAPNFDAASLSAAPTLQRAFDTSAAFKAHSGAPAAAERVPSGFALKIDGAMAIDSAERVQHVLGGWNQGLGTAVYRVAAMPTELSGAAANDDAAVRRMNEAAADALPQLISPAHRVALMRTSSALEDDHYALFVTANDVPAARRLVQYTAARAASDRPLTLGTLAESAEYEHVLQSSAAVRDMLARQYASATGMQLVEQSGSGALVPERTTLTHYVARANDLAHGAHDSLAGAHTGHESEFYVVYNSASDASQAARGAVVAHGALGGATLLSNADPAASADGGWQQPNFLSLLPAHSGARHATHTRHTALHASANERARAAADARLAFHSDLGAGVPHPNADEPHYSMQDPYTTKWLDYLSPSIGDDAIPLDQAHYTFVAGQLPNISTLYASPAMLGRVARHSAAPQNVPVALDNDLVSRIVPLYDAVVKPSKYSASLAEIFRNTYEQERTPGGFALLASESALSANADYTPDASLYADAEEYGLSRASGAYVGTSAAARNSAIDELRVRLAPHSTDFDSQTVLMLDRDLIQLLTE